MQRIDPKYTPEQQAAEAAAAAQVRANLKQQAEGPLNIPRFAFHSVSAALMIGSYMGLKVWMSNFPPLEDNVSRWVWDGSWGRSHSAGGW